MAQQTADSARQQSSEQQETELPLVEGETYEQKKERKEGDRLLQEVRILLQGVQILGGFLIVLPFNSRFNEIDPAEKWVYLATFVCATASMVFFSAPATHQRLPQRNIDAHSFKEFATLMIILGVAGLSLAMILTAQFVIAFVFDETASLIVSAIIAVLIAVFWWLAPQFFKGNEALCLNITLACPALALCVPPVAYLSICRVRRVSWLRLMPCPVTMIAAPAVGYGSSPTHLCR